MKFKVKIIEELVRTVIVEADDKERAYEKASILVNEEINLDYEDFSTRDIDVQGEATPLELEIFDQY
ncbi:MAG: hypothetical protein E6X95_16205 [Thomasclavelia ramosa]|nr:hypothetical protein [Thomasclavelia ramosa]